MECGCSIALGFLSYGVLFHVCISLGRDLRERERKGGISTDWWDASWMLSLPSVLRIVLLAPASRVLAEESPSILVECLLFDRKRLVRLEVLGIK